MNQSKKKNPDDQQMNKAAWRIKGLKLRSRKNNKIKSERKNKRTKVFETSKLKQTF
jgi:hypothetical protein